MFGLSGYRMGSGQSRRVGAVAGLQIFALSPRLNGWLWYSGFMKILLVLGLAFILLLLLLILMFVGFALL